METDLLDAASTNSNGSTVAMEEAFYFFTTRSSSSATSGRKMTSYHTLSENIALGSFVFKDIEGNLAVPFYQDSELTDEDKTNITNGNVDISVVKETHYPAVDYSQNQLLVIQNRDRTKSWHFEIYYGTVGGNSHVKELLHFDSSTFPEGYAFGYNRPYELNDPVQEVQEVNGQFSDLGYSTADQTSAQGRYKGGLIVVMARNDDPSDTVTAIFFLYNSALAVQYHPFLATTYNHSQSQFISTGQTPRFELAYLASTVGPEYTIEDITESNTVTGVRLQGKVVVQSDPTNTNSDLTTTLQVPTTTAAPTGTGYEGEIRLVNDKGTLTLYAWNPGHDSTADNWVEGTDTEVSAGWQSVTFA